MLNFNPFTGSCLSRNSRRPFGLVLLLVFCATTVSYAQSVADAIGLSGIPIVGGGNGHWFAQTSESLDGAAARSGSISHSQTSEFSFDAFGPGEVSFYWKVSSESCCDRLRFYIDNVQQKEIRGEVDWVQETFVLAEGSHSLRWSYTKDGSVNTGQDAGWVDQVVIPNSHTVTFDLGALGVRSGGGNLVQIVPDGGGATAPIVAGNPGWALSGWDIAFDNVSEDLTVTAQYTGVPTHAVTFDLGTRGTLDSGDLVQTVNQGARAIEPVIAPYPGWVHVGWDNDFSNVMGDLIVLARYIPVRMESVSEDFSTSFPSEGWQIYSSSSYGRIVVVNERLRMDSTSSGPFVLNEAILTLDLAGAESATLSFQQIQFGDELHSLPESFSGHANGDGVSISADGTNWFTIVDETELNRSLLTTYEIDLVAERNAIQAISPGFDFSEAFQIKFQQYDNYPHASDGREWDNIQVDAVLPVPVVLIFQTPSLILEGATDIPCIIEAGVAPEEDLVVNLSLDSPLQGPSSVTIPGGQTSVPFLLSSPNNSIAEGNLALELSAEAEEYGSTSVSILVVDDDTVHAVVFDLGAHGTLTGGDLLQSVYGGQSGIAPEFDVEMGWIFTGWDTEFDYVTDALTVTAEYEILDFNVVFELGAHGSLVSGDLAQIVNYGSDGIEPVIEDAVGWEFVGWDTDFTNVTSDLTVTALYEIKYFSVNFIVGEHGVHNGGGSLTQQIVEGDSAIAPDVVANSGWFFDGWVGDFDSITADTTVTAQYLPIHTVTFDLDGKATRTGGGELVQSIVDGNSAVAPTFDVDAGWLFTGWDMQFNGVTGDLVVTAQYVVAYRVTFNLSDKGTLLSGGGDLVQQVAINQSAIPPLVNPDNGWALSAWDTDFSEITGDTSVLAIYVPTVEITFELGDHGTLDTGGLTQHIPAGGTAIAPEIEAADGWKFVGWDSAYTNVTSDTTITAQYFPESMVVEREQIELPDFGGSVAISGNIALVGAPLAATGGKVHVYTRSNGVWSKETELVSSDIESGDWFGVSVSLEGNTALIGAQYAGPGGQAYVFERVGDGAWVETAVLSSSDGRPSDSFGYSVSLSGGTALVGARYSDNHGDVLRYSTGSAYVFVNSGNVWFEQAKLMASDGEAHDYFGRSVSISEDYAIIGAHGDDDSGDSAGSAYIFRRSNGSWVEERKLRAGGSYNSFGISVAIDGLTAVVGALDAPQAVGRAYIYVKEGVNWYNREILTPPQGGDSEDQFGEAVAVKGKRVLVSAHRDDDLTTDAGSVYFYEREGNDWNLIEKILASDGGPHDRFGFSVGLSGDTILVGAENEEKAYFLDLGAPPAMVTFDVGILGTPVGGGAFTQLVRLGTSAIAPIVVPDSGYSVFWDEIFHNIESDLTVSAVYVPTYSVSFLLGDHATLVAGDLHQEIPQGGVASQPEFDVDEGWAFVGWDRALDSITEDRVISALYEPTALVGIHESKHTASDGTEWRYFGSRVSIDGDIAIVGMEQDDVNGDGSGSAYIFVRSGNTWIEQQKLLPSDGAAGHRFGASVSIEGDTALIGATQHIGGQNFSTGCVYVFVRRGDTWIEEHRLIAEDGQVGDRFGSSVEQDGTTALIGASYSDDQGSFSGSVYVFVNRGSAWIQEQKLLPSDGAAGHDFGRSISLSQNTAVVGAREGGGFGSQSGSVYVFVREGSVWTEQAKVIPNTGNSNDQFGQSVSISGNTLIVGAPFNDDVGTNAGAVYIFSREGSVWTQQAQLAGANTANYDEFGKSVFIRGNRAVVGAPRNEPEPFLSDYGSVYVFERHGMAWTESRQINSWDGARYDHFGENLALSGDVILIGAKDDDDLGNSSGSIYFYDIGMPSVDVEFDLNGHGVRTGGGELVQTLVFNTTASAPIVLADPGWHFDGWDQSFQFVQSDLIVTATYLPKHTVIFNLDGKAVRTGGGELEQTIIDSNGAIAPTFAVNLGWHFVGWDATFDTVTENLTVNAQFLPLFTVTFDLDGKADRVGGGSLTQQIPLGMDAQAPHVDDHVGWIFTGWDQGFESVSDDLLITALYDAGFHVVFDLDGKAERVDGGSLNQAVAPGEPAAAPVISAHSGWFFCGWDTDFSDVDDDMVITAQYKEVHTVSFVLGADGTHDGGGSLLQQVIDQHAAIEPLVTTDTNKVFTGWDRSFNAVTGDMVVTARYASIVTLTFDTGAHGTHVGGGALVQRGIPLLRGIAPEVVVNDGWRFVGWDRSFSVVNSDLTVTAQYVEDELAGILRTKVTVANGEAGRFGGSVALDGNYAVIGMPVDDSLGTNTGCAYIFVKSGDEWVESHKLLPPDPSDYLLFGGAVAIDGSTIAIGAYGANDFGSLSGAVYLYSTSGLYRGKLTADDGASGQYFGAAVSVDGNEILVGAYKHDAAYLFRQSFGSWNQINKWVYTGSHAQVGWDVSLDAGRALIGAPSRGLGSAFMRGSSYAELGSEFDIEHENLGRRVSLSGDWAFVANHGFSSSNVYVFKRNGNNWPKQVRLTPTVDVGEYFGSDVELDATTALIGASGENGGAYVFERIGDTWSEKGKLTGDKDEFFSASNIDIDGNSAVIGSPYDDGYTYFYQFNRTPYTVTFDLGDKGTRNGGGALVQQVFHEAAIAPVVVAQEGWVFDGWDIDFSHVAEDIQVTALYAIEHSVVFDLGAYGHWVEGDLHQTVPANGTVIPPQFLVEEGWRFVGWDENLNNIVSDQTITAQYMPADLVGILRNELTASNGVVNNRFGNAISISGDVALVGVNSGTNEGVYVFERLNGVWQETAILTVSGLDGNALFGNSVSVEGDTALIGARGDNDGKGSAYIFEKKNGVWQQKARLVAHDGEDGDQFGVSVSLSKNTAVIGTLPDDTSDGVYVFGRNESGLWVQQAKLESGTSWPDFNGEVAISGDTILIGATDDPYYVSVGAVHIYVRRNATWVEEARLSGGLNSRDHFGTSVSIDGDNALIGATGAYGSRAFFFKRYGGFWSYQSQFEPEGVLGFGTAVDIEGDYAVVGARYNATVFQYRDSAWSELQRFEKVESSYTFGSTVAVSGDTVMLGDIRDNQNTGAVYAYDLGAPPVSITFDLDSKGARIGGGDLTQLIKVGTSVTAPIVEPYPGWLFDTWDGDFSSVNQDLTITALYTVDPDDVDGDTMNDTWETLYFGSPNIRDGQSDWDKDGKRDVEEYVTGHDPTDSTDFFYVMSQSFSDGFQNVTLTFTSNDNHPDRRYRIFYKEDLSDSTWTESPLGAFSPDAGSITTKQFSLPSSPDSIFFKVDCYLE